MYLGFMIKRASVKGGVILKEVKANASYNQRINRSRHPADPIAEFIEAGV